MALPNFNKVYQVKCDASGSVIGAVLIQEGKLDAFLSEKLNDDKRKYYVYDQELYENFQCLKKWRHYLILKEFVLYTNHKSLQYLESH